MEGATHSQLPRDMARCEDEVRLKHTLITIRPKQEGSQNSIEHLGYSHQISNTNAHKHTRVIIRLDKVNGEENRD
jgi:hypothetical protein